MTHVANLTVSSRVEGNIGYYEIFAGPDKRAQLKTTRFSELDHFHASVMKEVPEFQGRLPPKTLMRNTGPAFVERRRLDIESYLRMAARDMAVAESAAFKNFFRGPRPESSNNTSNCVTTVPYNAFKWMTAMVPMLNFNGSLREIADDKEMQIFVLNAFAGTEFKLNVKASDTIAEVKAKIQDSELGIAPDQQLLSCGGTILEDASRLSDNSIQKESVLHLVIPQQPEPSFLIHFYIDATEEQLLDNSTQQFACIESNGSTIDVLVKASETVEHVKREFYDMMKKCDECYAVDHPPETVRFIHPFGATFEDGFLTMELDSLLLDYGIKENDVIYVIEN